jgi:hypothetical protein
MRRSLRWILELSALLVMLHAGQARAQVPAEHMGKLAFRILTFDRRLIVRAGEGSVNVAVLYRPGAPASEARYEEVEQAFRALAGKGKVMGREVKAVALPFSPRLADDLKRLKAVAVYVCVGLESETEVIRTATQAGQVLSLTDSEESTRAGLGIGIVLRETRAAVLVNLKAARAEGADLDSAFLKLAEVIR